MANKFFLESSKLGEVILRYINSVRYASDISFEIVIIFDRETWFSLLWNPVNKEWIMGKYTRGNYIRPLFCSTEKLLEYLKENSEYIPNIHGVVYRTTNIKKIYIKEETEENVRMDKFSQHIMGVML